MKLLLLNLLEAGKSAISLDVEHEQKDMCEAVGGCFLDLMSGQYRINPLEPKCWDAGGSPEDMDAPAAFRQSTRLSQHISFLRDFFRSYKSFTDRQIDVIEIMVGRLYERWRISDSTDFSRLTPEDYSDDLLTQTAGRSGEVGSKMMILLMAACDHFGSESYLLASKLAVKTGDVERLRFLMDQAETYTLEMEPGFVGRMIRDAYSLNPYIGREMMDHATNEQIAAAPAELMLAAAYNRDSRAAFTLARKGIDITGRASEVIRQYAQRGDAWELEQLIKDGMKIQPTNLSALKACVQSDLLGSAKLLLEKGTDYEKFLSWAKTIGYELPAVAAAELSEYWEQLDPGRTQGQDPGMGGMSLG